MIEIRVGNFQPKNYSVDDGVDGTISLFRRNSGRSVDDGIDGTIGLFRWNSGGSTEQKKNSRNSVPNNSPEEKNARNSVPWYKNRKTTGNSVPWNKIEANF